MKLSHRIEKNVCVVAVIGNFALSNNDEISLYLEPLIENPNIKILLIDFEHVEVIDSKGAGLLASVFKKLSNIQKELVLCELNINCHSVLKTISLDQIIEIHQTQKEALTEKL
ncbi:MAG: STAS domain-containing protein [SAR324 cluster bacterium]|nr:STAS domain-containing protein [SAR324 cluster bacterium]